MGGMGAFAQNFEFGRGSFLAYSDEVGRVYRSEVGHRADVKRATCTDPKRAILGAPAWVV